MKKRLIAALIFSITMIYLSISVSAAAVVFDTKVWHLAWTTSSTNYTKNWSTFTAPSTISTSSTASNNLCFAFKTNMIIPDDAIIVIVMNMQNYNLSSLTFRGVGQATSSTLPTAQTTTNALEQIQYTQEIIANTQIPIDTGTQFTITIRAKGFTNLYPIIGFKDLRQQTSNTSISIKSIDLYQSVQEAASSGTTPEEMRDVLSSWSEDELLPGIQESVQSGVASGMEEALQNEKQEASSEGGDLIDQIHGGLSGTFDDIEQATQSFTSLADALKYNGQTATLSVPAITLPFIGTISEGINWDMTGYIQQAFPSGFILLIRCIFSLGVVMYPILEITMQVQRLLDKGGK